MNDKKELAFLERPVSTAQAATKWHGGKVPAKLGKPGECMGCPLEPISAGFSRPEGKGTVPLMIVAEALGEQEAKDGLPLRPYAPSGSVVEQAIRQLGYDRQQFIIWNTVACRPPENKLEGTWYEAGAIAHCQAHFDQVVAQFRPKAFLALGNVALAALTGMTGKGRTVSHLRVYVLRSSRYPGVPVIPTYHPSFVRRGGLKLFWVMRHDLAKAVAIAKGSYGGYRFMNTPDDVREDPDRFYHINPNPAFLQKWINALREKGWFFSYDIETGYAADQDEAEREVRGKELTQIQFSMQPNEGIALEWGQEAAEFSREVFALTNPRGNHNAWRFDNRILRLNGIEPAPVGVDNHDTMAMWQVYQPDLPRGLQYVASFFGFAFPWKHFVTQDFGVYGIADVDAVQHIWEKLPKAMGQKINIETGKSVLDGYQEKFRQLQPILENMQRLGLGVDVTKRQALRNWIMEEISRTQTELQPLIPGAVKKRKAWKNWPEDCKELVSQYKAAWAAKKQAELEAIGAKVTKRALTLVVKPADLPHEWREKITTSLGYQWEGDALYKELEFNPNSSQQLKDLFKHYGVDVPVDVDGAETTGKGELRKLLRKCKVGEVVSVVSKTLEIRELTKGVGTYIDGVGWAPDEHGRVHTEYTFNSGTWQLTSTKPNVQNIPKHTTLGSRIRELIIPAPGNVLVEADYSSFHVLTLGFNAQSKSYMDLARSDAHSYVCAHMLRTRIKEDTKDELELATREHISDLAGWLDLPREALLDKLGWIKHHYGKGLRQQAKAGILGIGLGLGVDKLHSHNEASFNPSVAEAEQWIRDNPQATFYDPGTKRMRRVSTFPAEIQVMLAQEKLGKAAAKALRELLEKLFPEVFRWQFRIRQQAARDQFLVSRYGGIRWFHNVTEWNAQQGREVPGEDAEAAIAFFVQNDAFGKIREAMIEIWEETPWGGMMNNTVHDSLVFDVPEHLAMECAQDVARIMQRPAKMLKHPELCPEGLVCGVEVSIGKNWNELKVVRLEL